MYWSQIWIGGPGPPVPPSVMVSSATELQLEVFWVFANVHSNKRTLKVSTIFARHAAFHACLSSRSDHSRCSWHTHQTNSGYFDHGKTQTSPTGAPCRKENGTDSWISGLNLWYWYSCYSPIIILWVNERYNQRNCPSNNYPQKCLM